MAVAEAVDEAEAEAVAEAVAETSGAGAVARSSAVVACGRVTESGTGAADCATRAIVREMAGPSVALPPPVDDDDEKEFAAGGETVMETGAGTGDEECVKCAMGGATAALLVLVAGVGTLEPELRASDSTVASGARLPSGTGTGAGATSAVWRPRGKHSCDRLLLVVVVMVASCGA